MPVSIITWVNNDTQYEEMVKSCQFPAEFIKIGQEAKSMAEAYNIGTAKATGDVLVYCHQDVLFLDKDFDQQVAAALLCPSAGFAGVVGNVRLSSKSWWEVTPTHCRGRVRLAPDVHATTPGWKYVVNQDGHKWLDFGNYSGPARQLDGFLMATKHRFSFPEQLPGIHFLDLWMCREAERQGYTNRIFPTHVAHHSVGEVESADYWKNYGLYMIEFSKDIAASKSLPKLNLGCWLHKLPGWVNIDIDPEFGEVVADARKLPYEDGSVEEIYAGHILEHFSNVESDEALREWKRVLRPGGKITVTVPDMAKAYRMYKAGAADLALLHGAIMGAQDRALQNHHTLYDEDILVDILKMYFSDVTIVPDSPLLMHRVEWQTIATATK